MLIIVIQYKIKSLLELHYKVLHLVTTVETLETSLLHNIDIIHVYQGVGLYFVYNSSLHSYYCSYCICYLVM